MVPIPEGSESYSGESGYTEYSSTQEMLDQPGSLTGSGGWPEEGETPTTTTTTAPSSVSGACELSDHGARKSSD